MSAQGASPRRRGPGRRTIVVLALLVVVALAAYGIWSRSRATADLKVRADDASIPRVQMILPQLPPPKHALTLPGNIEAWHQAAIYGQVTGYISNWYKDYGAQVKAGDLLATVATPSLDAELAQAKAQLDTTQANYNLAALTAKRWSALAGTQAVAQQDVDIKIADAKAQKAMVEAARQNVAKFQGMSAFKRVVAPFDGIVTVRNINIGDYVGAQGAQESARAPSQPLFVVADVHDLRVFISVPQSYSAGLGPGLSVSLTLPQDPGTRIPAQFLTTAKAVNPATRAIVTELTLPNPNGKYMPGSFVNVQFEFPSDPGILIIPEQALLFRAQGMQVALIGSGGKVRLQKVTLGRNLGNTVEVTSGLTKDDKLVAAPSLGLLDGQTVKVVQPVAGANPSAGGGASR
ncbi:MAG: Multidrug resistance protein MdtA [Phenylobacterium sp.]|nr:Multidrug resistance protein MdtA [Phenylobacterium sp.]